MFLQHIINDHPSRMIGADKDQDHKVTIVLRKTIKNKIIDSRDWRNNSRDRRKKVKR